MRIRYDVCTRNCPHGCQGWLRSRPSDERRSLKTLFDGGSFAGLVRFVEQHVSSTSEYSQLCAASQTCALLEGLLAQTDERQIAVEYNRYERLYVAFAFHVSTPPSLGEQSQSNSSMHRYECAELCKDISLQRGRFCARSLASCIPRSSEDRSS